MSQHVCRNALLLVRWPNHIGVVRLLSLAHVCRELRSTEQPVPQRSVSRVSRTASPSTTMMQHCATLASDSVSERRGKSSRTRRGQCVFWHQRTVPCQTSSCIIKVTFRHPSSPCEAASHFDDQMTEARAEMTKPSLAACTLRCASPVAKGNFPVPFAGQVLSRYLLACGGCKLYHQRRSRHRLRPYLHTKRTVLTCRAVLGHSSLMLV